VNEVAPGLEELAAELETVADKLRSEAIDAAELAQRIGSEIDARSRTAGEAEGQERLL
jgi:hypothetical protein